MSVNATTVQIPMVIIFACTLLSCERVETDPPNFPIDPFLDAATYQAVLGSVSPDEWEVVAFDRTEANPDSQPHQGIVFALSRHTSKDEFLFLYHFLGGRNDTGFSVKNAIDDPQPVAFDTFNPTKVEWRSRQLTFLDREGSWRTHSERIGNRYPIYGTLEDIEVHGRFGNYNIRISFYEEKQNWDFFVEELNDSDG